MSNPNIYENEELREPQTQGYFKVYDYFVVKNKHIHAIVVLPTGVGKTGLMEILPILGCPILETLQNLGKCRIYKAYSTFAEIANVS